MTKKSAKTILTNDTGTYLNIMQIACDCTQLLEQYNRQWMPKNMRKQFDTISVECHKLAMLAEKLANVEFRSK